jgi:hypothetical protein
MADITDPTITGYVNDFVRPYCNNWVGMKLSGDTALLTWFATISVSPEWVAAADGDLILDGSQTDSRTPLTKADITNIITQVLAFQTQSDLAGVFGVMNKAKVRINLP